VCNWHALVLITVASCWGRRWSSPFGISVTHFAVPDILVQCSPVQYARISVHVIYCCMRRSPSHWNVAHSVGGVSSHMCSSTLAGHWRDLHSFATNNNVVGLWLPLRYEAGQLSERLRHSSTLICCAVSFKFPKNKCIKAWQRSPAGCALNTVTIRSAVSVLFGPESFAFPLCYLNT
jgi:hypothetical protein